MHLICKIINKLILQSIVLDFKISKQMFGATPESIQYYQILTLSPPREALERCTRVIGRYVVHAQTTLRAHFIPIRTRRRFY